MQPHHPLHLAWFAPAPPSLHHRDEPRDHLALLAAELARTHRLDRFDAGTAHQFVWKHFRTPYNVCVFELADTAAHAFVWPYLLRYAGVVVVRTATLAASRAAALRHAHRDQDYADERAWAGSDLLGAPLRAARLVVVFDEAAAGAIREAHPGVDVRVLPAAAHEVSDSPRSEQLQDAPAMPAPPDRPGPVRFGLTSASHRPVVERALQRARDAGARAELLDGLDEVELLRRADVILALQWPPASEPPPGALAAMAAGKAVVVFETEATATWPLLDPQTWQPRGYRAFGEPMAVSIDLRDDEHSLMLTIKRLSGDSRLRAELAHAAAGWCREHATLAEAMTAWQQVLQAAIETPAPDRPAGWPGHLVADGTAHLRAVLDEFGVNVDFL
jgi:hypothetical protein